MLHALWRGYSGPVRPSVVGESELDMNRHEPQPHGHKPRLWSWFGVGGGGVMGSPRRSVDRELQEDWPTQY